MGKVLELLGFAGTYEVKALCENCGKETMLIVPRGQFVYEFMKTKKSVCIYCGCRIQEVSNEEIDPKHLEEKHKAELQKLRDRLKGNG